MSWCWVLGNDLFEGLRIYFIKKYLVRLNFCFSFVVEGVKFFDLSRNEGSGNNLFI